MTTSRLPRPRCRAYFAAVKPMGKALVLELMRFENELVDPAEIKFPSADSAKVRPQERAMAVQLIENLADVFDPSKYRDEYQDKLKAISKAKAKGKTLAVDDVDERENTNVIDLVSRLQERLAATAKRGGKKTAAKKTAAKKTTRRRKTA